MSRTLKDFLVEGTNWSTGDMDVKEFFPPYITEVMNGMLESSRKISDDRLEELKKDMAAKGQGASSDRFILQADEYTTLEDIKGLVSDYYLSNGFEECEEDASSQLTFEKGDESADVRIDYFESDIFSNKNSYMVSELRRGFTLEEDMTGYETLDKCIGEDTSPGIKAAAKEIYDLAKSTLEEPSYTGVYHAAFTGITRLLLQAYIQGDEIPSLESIRLGIQCTGNINPTKVKDFITKAFPVVKRSFRSLSAKSSGHQANFLDRNIRDIEKLVGAYILAVGGDIKGYTAANSSMNRNMCFPQNPLLN